MDQLYVISGAAGMTGRELVKVLTDAGKQVLGFDNFFASSMENIEDLTGRDNFLFFNYDINNRLQMDSIKSYVLKSACKNVVYVNCAAVVHTEYFYHAEDTFQTNVLGMRSFLAQAIEVGAGCFINCSSSEVYSMQSYCPGGVKEDDYIHLATAEHSQRTSYATGKLMTEFFMREAVNNGCIRGCSIRFANVYGNYERFAKHIIPHIASSLMQSGEVTLLHNAKETSRTFLHNSDSCGAVLALINTEGALDGSVYNVATQEEISIIDLVHLIADKLGIDSPLIHFSGTRSADPPRRVLCTDKIYERTGWRPLIGLNEGIDQVLQALKGKSLA